MTNTYIGKKHNFINLIKKIFKNKIKIYKHTCKQNINCKTMLYSIIITVKIV